MKLSIQKKAEPPLEYIESQTALKYIHTKARNEAKGFLTFICIH